MVKDDGTISVDVAPGTSRTASPEELERIAYCAAEWGQRLIQMAAEARSRQVPVPDRDRREHERVLKKLAEGVSRIPEAPISLLPKQVNYAVSKMEEWINISGVTPSAPDVSHSAFLHRLLSGKPALPYPPPTLSSYPCYELAEGKRVCWDRATDGKFDLNLHRREWVIDASGENMIRHAASGVVYKVTFDNGFVYLQRADAVDDD